jgi:hypothetical protein
LWERRYAMAGVIYVDRAGKNTEDLTTRLDAVVAAIEAEGDEIVAVAENVGFGETVGLWVFWRSPKRRAPGEPRLDE